jgi:restriction system protein
MADIPTFDNYMNPMLDGLRQLGGSATVPELVEKVVETMGLDEEQLSVIHNPERGNQSEVEYRMAWARTYLKKGGYLENTERGVWALTPKGLDAAEIDPRALVREIQSAYMADKAQGPRPIAAEQAALSPPEEAEGEEWRSQAMDALMSLSPGAFERFCQRVLREAGFVEVEVTGRSGDGGIDGTGIVRLQNVVSMQVLFQCKRWQGSVPPRELRDFRGAMAGRTDKGLFITTGTFSRDARKEATRDGAPPIDLIDGERLLDLLRSLRLGVRVEIVETVSVDVGWFKSFERSAD